MAKYDKYYQKENYFGKPYADLLEFFRNAKIGTLVDLGAGQGRDSLALAEMGYRVTAVEISGVGISQIARKNAAITLIEADLYDYNVSEYDYVLLDSIIHFYKNDIERETGLIKRILTELKPGGVLINCLLHNDKAEALLKKIIMQYPVEIIQEKYILYPDFKATYHMLVVRKRCLQSRKSAKQVGSDLDAGKNK